VTGSTWRWTGKRWQAYFQPIFFGRVLVADSNTHRLVGKNYTTPDLVAKVTGRARYAEDFKADGMLFAKLLLSPMPHARVTRIDASQALAMPGVNAILTVDDLPAVVAGANLGEGITSRSRINRLRCGGARPLCSPTRRRAARSGHPAASCGAV
jgi:CO/xanthine dehydrogenase Mo-binding subunit